MCILRRFAFEDPTRLEVNLAGAVRELCGVRLTEVDVLLSLYTCGGFADLALSLASRCNASAYVYPCCYGKHEELCPDDAQWGLGNDERVLL